MSIELNTSTARSVAPAAAVGPQPAGSIPCPHAAHHAPAARRGAAAAQGGEGADALGAAAVRTAQASEAAELLEQIREASIYVVQDGDWLSSIAAKLGVSTEELYALNRDTIGPDPDRIEPGMELIIPGSPLAQLTAAVSDPADDEPPITSTDAGTDATGADSAPVSDAGSDTPPTTPGGPTGVSEAEVEAARARNVSTAGLVPQSLRNLERANEYGLHLTGGVGSWNEWHMDGSSVDVSNYAGQGFVETPEMRAYADEMYELGRSGAVGPDGGLLVTHVVYAGMKAGASTNWQWVPVSQPGDITQGHWDHVHVETDSFV